jgi:hypothetical protein
MSLRVSHTTINATDAHALSVFWAAVFGYAENPDDPNESGHEECMIFSPDLRHRILFIEVEDLVADRRTPDGKGWVILADPGGNTFCVLRSDAERRAMGDPILPGPADIPGVETRPGGSIPILPMGDPASALAWWGRLGFAVEFEHRFAPELPLYVGLRRDMADVHLSQHRRRHHGSWSDVPLGRRRGRGRRRVRSSCGRQPLGSRLPDRRPVRQQGSGRNRPSCVRVIGRYSHEGRGRKELALACRGCVMLDGRVPLLPDEGVTRDLERGRRDPACRRHGDRFPRDPTRGVVTPRVAIQRAA